MTFPLEITFHNLTHSEAVEQKLRQYAGKLSKFFDHIISGKITINVLRDREPYGKLLNVQIELKLPGKVLIANKHPNEDLHIAIRDEFAAITRELEDHVKRMRGHIKTHSELKNGRISKMFADYGFIETALGEEYYFKKDYLVDVSFDQLVIGDQVHFLESTNNANLSDSLQAVRIRLIEK